MARSFFSELVVLASLAFTVPACDKDATPSAEERPPPGERVQSSKPRLVEAVPVADTTHLTHDDAAFGFDVLRRAPRTEGFFVSPHSMSIALAMTYAGARGNTAQQMAGALHFTLPSDRLHAAFGGLDLELAHRAETRVESGKAFELEVLNAIWGQRGYVFSPAFLDVLAERYGAGLSLLDFVGDTEGSREAINGWVSDRTRARIPELLPQGVITSATVLVLTNAIYFKASWLHPFEPSQTASGSFTPLDGGAYGVPLMHQTSEHRYAEGEGWQAVELLYTGEKVSMLVLVPKEGAFAPFVETLDADRLESIVAALGTRAVELAFPRFTTRTRFRVKETLQALGMKDAFEAGVADFSGMDGSRSLFVQDVVHEAFVNVDEKGTEAAAATAVVVGRTSAPERAKLDVTRPFVVVIRDLPTGAVLFLGQITHP